MKEQKLLAFQTHLNELMQNEEFAEAFEEEKLRMRLALEIAESRQGRSVSQKELAARAGITQQQLSKLERGENCNITTFLKVCNALGIDVVLKIRAFS